MFLVLIDYIEPLDRIDAAMDEHLQWLDRHYTSSGFITSGPKIPRTGGIIIADCTRAQLDDAIDTDPFALQHLATHTVIEFTASAPGRGRGLDRPSD